MHAAQTDFDVLIIGAGISGIGMAAHLEMMCPHLSYGILDRRENLGGTWDLFRYPGIRSDSDMHTLGFAFEPWRDEKSIADGPAILDYLHRIVEERGIAGHIHYGHKVICADWREAEARWHITAELAGGQEKHLTANFLYLGSGYYDYDQPYDPEFDTASFKGQVVHPQFWPENFDYSGQRVLVIGSGATAVTIVPSMAAEAAHVTMLQRTPTWMFSRPAKDALANFLRKILPEEWAYRLTRWKNVRMQDLSYKLARGRPEKVKKTLKTRIQKILGAGYDDATFTPPYDPWDQRLCLVPDADLFEAMKAGTVDIVTGRIARFVETGVELENGDTIDADIIVTATGLKLAIAGKIAISQDGVPVDFSQRFYYKGVMFSNLPNLAVVFGYLNASWTLRSDINSQYICRVLNRMQQTGANIAVPVLVDDHGMEEDDIFDFSSGYLQRAKHIMPKSSLEYPWRMNQEYLVDRRTMKNDPVDDGLLILRKTGENAAGDDQGQDAEE